MVAGLKPIQNLITSKGIAYFALLALLIMFAPSAFAAPQADVIYGISPYYFVKDQDKVALQEITRRIPEIADLGATILWLQPIFPSATPGQGYDVIDYLAINPQFGNARDLKNLVKVAHKNGLKVLLDIPLNHTSIQHPFAQDVVKKGVHSQYADFYQSEIAASTPYSEHAKIRREGKATFVRYFWEDFVNLNYSSPRVKEYVGNVLDYWVKEFDIDGYRLDAGWGPQSRWPEFYKTVASGLRKIKPDIKILAEDSAGYPARYEESKHQHLKGSGVFAAYDWKSDDPDWLSKWAFQTGDTHGETIFNSADPRAATDVLVRALQSNQERAEAPTLRYIENNDTGSFLENHTREQAKFAMTLEFLLPGVPLIFYGQELGIQYPQWQLPSIDPQKSLKSYDPEIWNHLQGLIELKKSSDAFRLGKIDRVKKVGSTEIEIVIKVKEYKENLRIDLKKLKILRNGTPFKIVDRSLRSQKCASGI